MITVGLHQRHRLTETNRQTDRQISCDSIVRTMLGWRTSCNGSWTPQHVSSATHGSLTTVWRTFDVIFYTGWMYQNVSHSSYAWPSTSVCTEWDRYICRRCAGRARRRLVVVICVLQKGILLRRTVCVEQSSWILNIWQSTRLHWTILSGRLNVFCLLGTDTAHGTH